MKILKVSQPLIAYLCFETAVQTISLGQQGLSNWLNCHYVNIGVKESEFNTPELHFIDTPDFLDMDYIPLDIIYSDRNNFLDTIKNLLDSEYYILIHVDTFFVPCYTSYQKRHYPHPALVYGYDDENIYLADFFAFSGESYDFSKCTYDEFADAINYTFEKYSELHDFQKEFTLFKVNQKSEDFSIDTLIQQLKNHFNSVNDDGKTNTVEYEAFGLKIYDKIINYAENVFKHGANFDARMTGCQEIHKQLLLQKIDFLAENGFISEHDYFSGKFKDLLREVQIFKSLVLKYNLTKNEKMATKILKILDTLKEKERLALEKLISKL